MPDREVPEWPAAASPKVSVVAVTYNQEPYIRATLDSFVAQQTEFPVEFIVADDASTDATPTIIAEYAETHPRLFRPILRSENLGVLGNWKATLAAARGEYLAICEGDDYWTDPLKLAKQVDYLDRHPETTVCFHPVRVIGPDAGTNGSEYPPIYLRGDLSVEALLARNFIQTNSVMYRRLDSYDDIPDRLMPVDWYLHVLHALRGGIAILPETMGVYRLHAGGLWQSAYGDQTMFWLKKGPGFLAMLEAMLDLVLGDSQREAILGQACAWALGEIAKIPGPQSRAALLEHFAAHPRLAMLALLHERSNTRWRRLTSRLALEKSGWKARANVYAGSVKRRRSLGTHASNHPRL